MAGWDRGEWLASGDAVLSSAASGEFAGNEAKEVAMAR